MLARASRLQAAPAPNLSACDPPASALRPALGWRALLASALLALALAGAVYEGLAGQRSPVAPGLRAAGRVNPGAPRLRHGATPLSSLRTSPKKAGLLSLPKAARGPVSGALGANDPAYSLRASASGFVGSNPAQHLGLRFGGSGVSLSSAKAGVGLALRAVGYGSSLTALAAVAPHANGNRLTYAHRGLTEWYANGPLGLEQGFTIATAPAGHPLGALTLSMALTGDAHASLASGGRGVILTRAGRPVLRYDGLTATDARGRALHSWLQLEGGRLELHVDAAGARYPLRIDPFIQQGAKLTGGSEEAGEGAFGASVALSADGNTALIGGYGDNANTGAAWVFTRSGSTWTQEGPKLTAKSGEESEGGLFGFSVALSVEGSNGTAVIAAPDDNGAVGAAWIFTRSGSTWTQQGTKLTAKEGEESEAGQFGTSVAIASKEGNTALIGGPADSAEAGAAWVFTRTSGVWTQQGTKLTGSEATGEFGAAFGDSVALSAEGSTALIGGRNDGESAGAAWVFTRTSGVWTQQGAKLTAKAGEEAGQGEFGGSVALSGEGNTALIGAPFDNALAGAAWVFTRTSGVWTQQGAKLTGSGETGEGLFGSSVALSSEGNTGLIGGGGDSADVGAAWVFTRTSGVWTQQGGKLTGSGETGAALFGFSVSLSSKGTTGLIGGLDDNGLAGAAWVFVSVNAPTAVTKAASSVTPTSAILNATVNPNGGEVTECEFEYGTTTAYGKTAPCGSLPGSGESPVAVSATVTGLAANITYHFRIVASNSVGKGEGSDETFKTLTSGSPPAVVTKPATAVTNSSASLNATVNPNGATVTECKLEYGTTVSYGSSGPCTPSPGSGSSPVAVSAAIGLLNGGTTYHFRISATNAGGTSTGSDQTFTTLSSPHWQKNGTKVKEGEKLGTISWGTLTLESSGGATVTCKTAAAANMEDTATTAKDETQLFSAYECKAVGGKCAAEAGETKVGSPGLPPFGWPGVAKEEGEGTEEFRLESSGVQLNIECYKSGLLTEHTLFKTGLVGTETGTWTPKWQDGLSGAKPSEMVFDTSSGHLFSETGGLKLTIKGKLKVAAFEGTPLPLVTIGAKGAP